MMDTHANPQPKSAALATLAPGRSLLLQRKCACGGSAGKSGECEACAGKKRLQAKLTIGASNDPLEHEADRIADQVLTAPGSAAASGSPPRIQRFAGQPVETATAPASVDQALASSGRPLEPALRRDMEQRFGHDFSRVRVHADADAGRSAQDVDALVYTVGPELVFGAGRFAPHTHEGRRLLAHELAHVVQQAAAPARVQRQPAKTPKVVAPVNPGPTQQKMIDAARRAAAVRTQVAMFRASGTEGTQHFLDAKRLAQIKFDWPDPNMEQIGGVLAGMGGGLVTVDVKVAGAGDPECGTRSGYVRGHAPPIVLCPGFFKDPADNEGRIRTLIHEMAHVKGIGKADVAEQYYPIFDCDSKGAFEAADAWANYVHCLSGQQPDKPPVITGKGGSQTPPKKAGKK
jgi:hypothetical protein